MTGQKGLIQTCSHFMFEIFFLTSNKKTISHVSVGRIYHLNISVRPAGNQCAKVELGILFFISTDSASPVWLDAEGLGFVLLLV